MRTREMALASNQAHWPSKPTTRRRISRCVIFAPRNCARGSDVRVQALACRGSLKAELQQARPRVARKDLAILGRLNAIIVKFLVFNWLSPRAQVETMDRMTRGSLLVFAVAALLSTTARAAEPAAVSAEMI